jgi:adenylylsulfate kinase-like enzyme
LHWQAIDINRRRMPGKRAVAKASLVHGPVGSGKSTIANLVEEISRLDGTASSLDGDNVRHGLWSWASPLPTGSRISAALAEVAKLMTDAS